MAEQGDAVRVDDVETSSDEEEEDEEESSMESDESLTAEESSTDEEGTDEELSDDTNVWDSVDDGVQTEEAIVWFSFFILMMFMNHSTMVDLQEASLQASYVKALNLIVEGRRQEAFTVMKSLLQHPILQKFEVLNRTI